MRTLIAPRYQVLALGLLDITPSVLTLLSILPTAGLVSHQRGQGEGTVPTNGHSRCPGALGHPGQTGRGSVHPCSLWAAAAEGSPASLQVSQGQSHPDPTRWEGFRPARRALDPVLMFQLLTSWQPGLTRPRFRAGSPLSRAVVEAPSRGLLTPSPSESSHEPRCLLVCFGVITLRLLSLQSGSTRLIINTIAVFGKKQERALLLPERQESRSPNNLWFEQSCRAATKYAGKVGVKNYLQSECPEDTCTGQQLRHLN